MDSDDDIDEVTPTWRGIPGTIILINVLDPSDKNTASTSHAATCRMVRQYLRASNSRNIGVCLYGTEDSSNTSTFATKNVIDIFPLSTPTLDDYNKLRTMDIKSYNQAKELQLSDVLWHCDKMFSNAKKQFSLQTVIMLTRLDTPPIASDQDPTLKRVSDLVDKNIELKVINISENDYEIHSFYKSFLFESYGRNFIIPKPMWDSKEIEQVMHQETHRHLAVARMSFEIGGGMSIGVGIYNLLIRPGSFFQKKVNLDRETNAVVSSMTKTVKVTTDTSNTDSSSPMDVDVTENPKEVPLLRSEILHYVEYGDKRVEFTDSEKKSLQNPFGPPMMKLLGFKPAVVMCKEKWFIKTGYFLFPNDAIIEGSTVAFKAMHQACITTKTVAICVLCTRINAKHNIVALSPCTHPLGLDVEIGFDVIHIPFVENVRDLLIDEDEEPTNTSEEQKLVMKDILKSLQFEYKPNMFENPKLQCEYRAIEAIALEEENLDPFVDSTISDNEKFQSIPGDIFEELFGPFGAVATKRPAAPRSSHQDPTNKRAKADEELDESFVKSRVEHGTVNKFTVDQLKKLLKCKHDSDMPALTGLKKPALIDLVYKYYS